MEAVVVRTKRRIGCFAAFQKHHATNHPTVHHQPTSHPTIFQPPQRTTHLHLRLPAEEKLTIRRGLLLSITSATTTFLLLSDSPPSKAGEFFEIPDSGGVKALDLRMGAGSIPVDGDQVSIYYYGRLAAKQGWRFDSTYDHKDGSGEPVPFVFVLGSGNVISGIQAAVRSMKVGGIRRVIIPPSQGYQSTSQEPIPPNFFDRQRLFTTIFNPTRIANGEGSTLGTLIFDIELVSLRH